MTRQNLNTFIAETEAAMTERERAEWMALNHIERKAAAWAAYIAIHGAS